MNLEKAKELLAEAIEGRRRWGKHFDGAQLGVGNILDALLVLEEHNSREGGAALARANRQLGAARAREEGLKKRLALLKEQRTELEKRLLDLTSEAK